MSAGSVALALSGGVDSSAAALLLLRQGYAVTGVTFALWGDESPAADAARVCQSLGIPHLVWDYRADFSARVIDRFVEGYRAGRTPNPCVFCNESVKFGRFFDDAMAHGFDYISTGHYARTQPRADGVVLLRAADRRKDQSYVLYQLSQRQLCRLLLPIGQSGLTKPALRALAAEAGLPTAQRPDSQDICFIPDGDHAAFLQRHGAIFAPGRFVDEAGRVLGQHRGGACRFTLGQRKGLGIGLGQPAYVLGFDGDDVILTTDEARLFHAVIELERATFCDGRWPDGPFDADARIRYSHREAPARITPLPDHRLRLVFAQPQRAPTPGQAAVLYAGDEVLGGGVIAAVCD